MTKSNVKKVSDGPSNLDRYLDRDQREERLVLGLPMNKKSKK
jgi:hypothetical protein